MTIWCQFGCVCSPRRNTGLKRAQLVKPCAKLLLAVPVKELETFTSAREVDLLEGMDPWIQPHQTGIVLRLERWSNAPSPAACVPHVDQERLATILRGTAIGIAPQHSLGHREDENEIEIFCVLIPSQNAAMRRLPAWEVDSEIDSFGRLLCQVSHRIHGTASRQLFLPFVDRRTFVLSSLPAPRWPLGGISPATRGVPVKCIPPRDTFSTTCFFRPCHLPMSSSLDAGSHHLAMS